MNPIAFNLFGLDIRWYGILISLGLLTGLFIAYFTCRWKNINFDTLLDIILIALPVGVIGARAYYVLLEFGSYKDNPIDVFNIREGGLAIHGGIIFAMTAALLYTHFKKIDFLKMADVAAPSLIIAQAIGRWGNFFNGEAHGGEVSYNFISHFPGFIQKGMYIDGKYYHPTFLYESMWDILVFIILITLLKKSTRKGAVIFSYIGLYSLGRFFIEGLRTDSLMIGSFRVAQLVSIFGIITSIVFLSLRKKFDNNSVG